MMRREMQGEHRVRPYVNTVGATLVVALVRTADGLEKIRKLKDFS